MYDSCKVECGVIGLMSFTRENLDVFEKLKRLPNTIKIQSTPLRNPGNGEHIALFLEDKTTFTVARRKNCLWSVELRIFSLIVR